MAHELVEWGAAVTLGQGTGAFPGTRGDPWNTQSDRLFALVGGIAPLSSMPRLLDRQLAALEAPIPS